MTLLSNLKAPNISVTMVHFDVDNRLNSLSSNYAGTDWAGDEAAPYTVRRRAEASGTRYMPDCALPRRN